MIVRSHRLPSRARRGPGAPCHETPPSLSFGRWALSPPRGSPPPHAFRVCPAFLPLGSACLGFRRPHMAVVLASLAGPRAPQSTPQPGSRRSAGGALGASLSPVPPPRAAAGRAMSADAVAPAATGIADVRARLSRGALDVRAAHRGVAVACTAGRLRAVCTQPAYGPATPLHLLSAWPVPPPHCPARACGRGPPAHAAGRPRPPPSFGETSAVR